MKTQIFKFFNNSVTIQFCIFEQNYYIKYVLSFTFLLFILNFLIVIFILFLNFSLYLNSFFLPLLNVKTIARLKKINLYYSLFTKFLLFITGFLIFFIFLFSILLFLLELKSFQDKTVIEYLFVTTSEFQKIGYSYFKVIPGGITKFTEVHTSIKANLQTGNLMFAYLVANLLAITEIAKYLICSAVLEGRRLSKHDRLFLLLIPFIQHFILAVYFLSFLDFHFWIQPIVRPYV